MPLTATPKISDATTVAPMLRTRVPAHSAAVPATIAITTDSREQRRVVAHAVGHAHRLHAQVVHGGDADADDGAADEQRPPAAVPVADDEQPDAHHDDRDQHRHDRDGHVVEDRLTGDREAQHRDEVHGPDAPGADRDGGQDQPAGPGGPGVGPGPGDAAQPEERAKTGHGVAEYRVDEAIGKVMNGDGHCAGSPSETSSTGGSSAAGSSPVRHAPRGVTYGSHSGRCGTKPLEWDGI